MLEIIREQRQPGPNEMMNLLVGRVGWRSRTAIRQAAKALASDRGIESYVRTYFSTVLTDEALVNVLTSSDTPDTQFVSDIDQLLLKTKIYRSSGAFRDAIGFIARFRQYSPYNNLLVKIQNPSCSFFASSKDWKTRFHRTIREDARPLVILAPGHPFMLVYDIDSTEGPPLPEKFQRFAHSDGEITPRQLQLTVKNAERDGIKVRFKKLSSLHGGFATTEVREKDYKRRIVVHLGLDTKSRYSVLIHELAHIYLGHLGADVARIWPSRIYLSHQAVEIEAEAVSYIVSIRAGLIPSSAEYLSSYIQGDAIPSSVSLELVAKTASRIEEMGKKPLPKRRPKSRTPSRRATRTTGR